MKIPFPLILLLALLHSYALLAILSPTFIIAAEPVVPAKVPWDEIRRSAETYVHQESPSIVWPFERPSRDTLASSSHKVFAHYFLPFPLSIDNRPLPEDYYTKGFLTPDGERGKHAEQGGYLRERPLTPPPSLSPYWRETNLAIEILRAREMGIDGFTCDLLQVKSSGVWDRYLMLLEVCAAVAPDFHIVIMPDMEADLKTHPEWLEQTILELAGHPATYRLPDGRVLVSPFDAQRQPPAYWQDLERNLAKQSVPIAFLPLFQGWRKYATDYAPISYGFSDWGLRDVDSSIAWGETLRDEVNKTIPVWMMPVVPQDMRPKDTIAWESGNTRAFRELWKTAIMGQFSYVQLITWNDYSEHTEVSPSSGTQFLFYDLSAYFNAWFKTGVPPKIIKDAFYYCHRKQIFPLTGPTPQQSRAFKLVGRTALKNEVEMIALVTAPATMEIELGGVKHQLAVGSGLSSFIIPAQPGRPIFRIIREGQVLSEITSAWEITTKGEKEDPLYYGGSNTRTISGSSLQ